MGKKESLANYPKRGEVYVVSFDPVRGHEIAKTRPALVIQNNIGNRESGVVIVAAITSYQKGDHLYPVNVLMRAPEGGLKKDSVVHLDQIRSVDKERLSKRLGVVKAETVAQVNRALAISLGLVELD